MIAKPRLLRPRLPTPRLLLIGCAAALLGIGTASAGPCDTGNKDAGSGSTPGYTGQTTGMASSGSSQQHPPTDTMNRATEGQAASSEDAQKQMQGHPTAAQQAEGAKPSTQTADKGC
jgi:hypothetical protein